MKNTILQQMDTTRKGRGVCIRWALGAGLFGVLFLLGCTTANEPSASPAGQEGAETRSSRRTLEQDIEQWIDRAETSRAHLPPTPAVPDGRVGIPSDTEHAGVSRNGVSDVMGAERGAESDPLHPELRKTLPALPIETLSMREPVEIAAFLSAMGEMAGKNILFSERLTGLVQINLNSPTTWDQLFLTVLRKQGLTYEWEGDLLCVVTQDDLTNRLNLERLREQHRVVEHARLQVEPLQLSTLRIRYADAEGIREQLEKILTRPDGVASVPRGSVTVDKGNNAVIMNAIERDLQNMVALVSRLDRPVAQILIEAHIVETNRDTARELGVQWGGAYRTRSGESILLMAGGTEIDSMGDFIPSALSSGGFAVGGGVLRGEKLLTMQLAALEQEGRIKILSSPSITTLNNQAAYIESGKEVPYRVESGAGAGRDFTTEWKRALLRLEVIPSVIDDELIRLGITTSKDDLDDTVLSDGLPRVITKRAETTLILRDGQTTVIGGLSQQSERQGQTGIPWLHRMPLLGSLFRRTNVGSSMEDLLIFITPRLLSDHLSMADEAAYRRPDLDEDEGGIAP